MSLKSRTVIHQEVNYEDLEQFVQKIIGREWSFVAAGEYGNGEQHTFTPNGQPLDDWDAKAMRRFVDNGNDYPHPETMFKWLATEKHIQPGRYLVSVYW